MRLEYGNAAFINTSVLGDIVACSASFEKLVKNSFCRGQSIYSFIAMDTRHEFIFKTKEMLSAAGLIIPEVTSTIQQTSYNFNTYLKRDSETTSIPINATVEVVRPLLSQGNQTDKMQHGTDIDNAYIYSQKNRRARQMNATDGDYIVFTFVDISFQSIHPILSPGKSNIDVAIDIAISACLKNDIFPAGYGVTNEHGDIIRWNRLMVSLTGVTQNMVSGCKIWSVLPVVSQSFFSIEADCISQAMTIDSNGSRFIINMLRDEQNKTFIGVLVFCSPLAAPKEGNQHRSRLDIPNFSPSSHSIVRVSSNPWNTSMALLYQQSNDSTDLPILKNISRNCKQHMSFGIAVYDITGVVIDWNSKYKQFYKLSPNLVKGRKMTDVAHSCFVDLRFECASHLQNIANNGGYLRVDLRESCCAANFAEMNVDHLYAYDNLVNSQDGNVIGYASFIFPENKCESKFMSSFPYDKNKNERTRELSRIVSNRTATMIAESLKSVISSVNLAKSEYEQNITSIDGFLETVRDSLSQLLLLAYNVESTIRKSKRVNNNGNEVAASPPCGQIHQSILSLKPVSVELILTPILEACHALGKSKGISVCPVKVSCDASMLVCDIDKIYNILLNIINDCVDISPNGSVITINWSITTSTHFKRGDGGEASLLFEIFHNRSIENIIKIQNYLKNDNNSPEEDSPLSAVGLGFCIAYKLLRVLMGGLSIESIGDDGSVIRIIINCIIPTKLNLSAQRSYTRTGNLDDCNEQLEDDGDSLPADGYVGDVSDILSSEVNSGSSILLRRTLSLPRIGNETKNKFVSKRCQSFGGLDTEFFVNPGVPFPFYILIADFDINHSTKLGKLLKLLKCRVRIACSIDEVMESMLLYFPSVVFISLEKNCVGEFKTVSDISKGNYIRPLFIGMCDSMETSVSQSECDANGIACCLQKPILQQDVLPFLPQSQNIIKKSTKEVTQQKS